MKEKLIGLRVKEQNFNDITNYYKTHKKEIGTTKAQFIHDLLLGSFYEVERGKKSISEIKSWIVSSIAEKIIAKSNKFDWERKRLALDNKKFGFSDEITANEQKLLINIQKEIAFVGLSILVEYSDKSTKLIVVKNL